MLNYDTLIEQARERHLRRLDEAGSERLARVARSSPPAGRPPPAATDTFVRPRSGPKLDYTPTSTGSAGAP